jgi:hypothetical protein
MDTPTNFIRSGQGYDEAFADWLGGMTEAERQKLAEAGITGPMRDHFCCSETGREDDVASSAVDNSVEQDSERQGDLGEALIEILAWLVGGGTNGRGLVGGGGFGRGWRRAAAARLAALSWVHNVNGVRSLPQKGIAEKIGVTRALISHYVRRAEDRWGFHAPGQKSKISISAYRAAAVAGWETRRQRADAKNLP